MEADNQSDLLIIFPMMPLEVPADIQLYHCVDLLHHAELNRLKLN